MATNNSNFKKHYRPRQKISRILKYLIFFVNLLFWLSGGACAGLGIYLYANDFRPVLEALDMFMNPAFLLIIAGGIIFTVSFLGCTGSLRENVCMLRAFAFGVFFCYVSLVILAFVAFIFFYSDTKTGISIQTVLQNTLKKYHESKNMAEMIDVMQSQLSCCGVSSLGYKDWNENSLYNCSRGNLSPERCGVPYSCCHPKTETSKGVDQSSDVFCGFGVQEKSISVVQSLIYIEGCLHPLQKVFESHAVIIGAVIGAIIIPVCLSVTLTNILAKQIDHQRYLLAREARREERRKHRNRYKYHLGYDGVAQHVVVKKFNNEQGTNEQSIFQAAPVIAVITQDTEPRLLRNSDMILKPEARQVCKELNNSRKRDLSTAISTESAASQLDSGHSRSNKTGRCRQKRVRSQDRAGNDGVTDVGDVDKCTDSHPHYVDIDTVERLRIDNQNQQNHLLEKQWEKTKEAAKRRFSLAQF